jgi:4-hydroxybenzoate polyprenyltransferase
MSFLKRFYIYQKERFPFAGYIFMVGAFSFSAVSYSRICRRAEGFIPWTVFLAGAFTTLTLFLLVRIFDEFKDHEDDMKYRKYLPVPRGLISLKELFYVGAVVVLLQVIVNLYFPKMFLIYLVVIGYLCLMGKEFFVSDWLKSHQFWYVTSHMFIIPLVDIYASGLDWLLAGVAAPVGLIYFFVVSYMNGIVLEIGRKIKTTESEEEGVLSYTKMLGIKGAPVVWLACLSATLCFALLAANYGGYGVPMLYTLLLLFIVCATPAIMFLINRTGRSAKMMEYASALWTFGMYLSLGGIPMILKMLQ